MAYRRGPTKKERGATVLPSLCYDSICYYFQNRRSLHITFIRRSYAYLVDIIVNINFHRAGSIVVRDKFR